MKIPEYDVYSFREHPNILYALKEYDMEIARSKIKLLVEMIIRKDCGEVLLEQGSAKKPNFMIRNSGKGLVKPVSVEVEKIVRKNLVSRPVGDMIEGCRGAIDDVSSVFTSMALPSATVNVRIPLFLCKKISFKSKLGSRRDIKRGIFELKPEHYGYVLATEEGLKRMIEKLEKDIRTLEQA